MSPPITAPYHVVDDFLPLELAEAMRRDIDEHFATPTAHHPNTHQIWNYWHVPGMYTYLRTQPEKIIQRQRMDRFLARLRGWAASTCGMGEVRPPYLSLYVPGCQQGIHNDAANGRFAYVYSLTRNERRTIGGETIVWREDDPFRSKLTRPAAGRAFYDLVEPRFNRLVIFDDRMPHAVERVEGSMDPQEGRFVMHGHMRDAGPIIRGPLSQEALEQGFFTRLQRALDAPDAARFAESHGPLVLRQAIAPNGRVRGTSVLLDRVVHEDTAAPDWRGWLDRLLASLADTAYPEAEAPTELIHPTLFGNALPPKPGR